MIQENAFIPSIWTGIYRMVGVKTECDASINRTLFRCCGTGTVLTSMCGASIRDLDKSFDLIQFDFDQRQSWFTIWRVTAKRSRRWQTKYVRRLKEMTLIFLVSLDTHFFSLLGLRANGTMVDECWNGVNGEADTIWHTTFRFFVDTLLLTFNRRRFVIVFCGTVEQIE